MTSVFYALGFAPAATAAAIAALNARFLCGGRRRGAGACGDAV